MSVKLDTYKHDFTYLKQSNHKALILCERINQGLKKQISPERIKKYCVWFFNHYLKNIFELEESYIFPILGKDHPIIKKALKEHRKINRLISDETDLIKSIYLLEELLESHIRYKERVLFVEIEKAAASKIKSITFKHTAADITTNSWSDNFWDNAS